MRVKLLAAVSKASPILFDTPASHGLKTASRPKWVIDQGRVTKTATASDQRMSLPRMPIREK
jgi:hypothetical protein